jgi:transposase
MNNWSPGMREKAEMILKVRGGLMSAAEAARKLGISRKTYYKWERRGLEAMMEGLCERNSGRPPGEPDGETERMKRRIRELERELECRRKADELHERVKQLSEKKE